MSTTNNSDSTAYTNIGWYTGPSIRKVKSNILCKKMLTFIESGLRWKRKYSVGADY